MSANTARKSACATSDYDSLSQSSLEGFDDSSRDCCHPAAIRLADGPGRGQADYRRETRTLVEWKVPGTRRSLRETAGPRSVCYQPQRCREFANCRRGACAAECGWHAGVL